MHTLNFYRFLTVVFYLSVQIIRITVILKLSALLLQPENHFISIIFPSLSKNYFFMILFLKTNLRNQSAKKFVVATKETGKN